MTKENAGRALVVGMGISGIATASRLRAAGWTPVIIERAAERRKGGYFVALFGVGRVSADRLGILQHLHDRRPAGTTYLIDRNGRKEPNIGFGDAPGNPWLMLRGDVEKAAFDALPKDVEIRYSTVPTAITQAGQDVYVNLLDTATGETAIEQFDLVVGADGLRSTVRSLVFGAHERYLHRLDHMVCAYQMSSLPKGLSTGQAAMLLEPGRSMWVFEFADHDPTVLLTYRTDDVDAEFTQTPAERIRAAFGPLPFGDTLGDVIEEVESAEAVLFDSAEQVRMDTWHNGRVVLLGDSAWSTTLYAGMGVSAGLVGADLLGAMLERYPRDIETALSTWEEALRPYIDEYQLKGIEQRKFFVADNWMQIGIRRSIPLLQRSAFGRWLSSKMMPRSGVSTTADIVGATLQELSERAAQSPTPAGRS